jgi:hypothetical protein
MCEVVPFPTVLKFTKFRFLEKMEDFGHACSSKKAQRKNHAHNLPPADVQLPPHSQVRSKKKRRCVNSTFENEQIGERVCLYFDME